MALSSISGPTHGAVLHSNNKFVPTKANSNVNVQTGSTGRGGDTYFCASCGGQKIVSSFYCPTCSGGSSARASSSTPYGQYNCPTCGKTQAHSAADRAGAAYYSNASPYSYSASWVR